MTQSVIVAAYQSTEQVHEKAKVLKETQTYTANALIAVAEHIHTVGGHLTTYLVDQSNELSGLTSTVSHIDNQVRTLKEEVGSANPSVRAVEGGGEGETPEDSARPMVRFLSKEELPECAVPLPAYNHRPFETLRSFRELRPPAAYRSGWGEASAVASGKVSRSGGRVAVADDASSSSAIGKRDGTRAEIISNHRVAPAAAPALRPAASRPSHASATSSPSLSTPSANGTSSPKNLPLPPTTTTMHVSQSRTKPTPTPSQTTAQAQAKAKAQVQAQAKTSRRPVPTPRLSSAPPPPSLSALPSRPSGLSAPKSMHQVARAKAASKAGLPPPPAANSSAIPKRAPVPEPTPVPAAVALAGEPRYVVLP